MQGDTHTLTVNGAQTVAVADRGADRVYAGAGNDVVIGRSNWTYCAAMSGGNSLAEQKHLCAGWSVERGRRYAGVPAVDRKSIGMRKASKNKGCVPFTLGVRPLYRPLYSLLYPLL